MSQAISHMPAIASRGVSKPLRVLILEHVLPEAELCVRELEHAGLECSADIVATREEFISRLHSHEYDLILADYRLPNWTGLEARDCLRQLRKELPFILVTGTLGEEAAVECIKQGVTDYVLKDHLARLPVAVSRALEEKFLRDTQSVTLDALRQSESGFRYLFANNPLPMCVVDTESLRFLEVNDAAVHQYGYSQSEFRRLRIHDIHLEDNVSRLLEAIAGQRRAMHAAGHSPHRVKDGSVIDVEIFVHGLDYSGRSAILVVSRDITEQLRSEREIRARAQQQAAVAALGQHALAGGDLASLFAEAARRIAETLGVEFSRVLELKHNAASALLRAGAGWKESLAGDYSFPVAEDHQVRSVLEYGEPLLVDGTAADSKMGSSALLAEHGVRSGVTVIIPGRDRPFGLLGAHTRALRRFTDDDAHFLQTVAHVLAAAIGRLQTEEALRVSETRYHQFVQNATYGIFRASIQGRLLEANPALIRMLGCTSQEEVCEYARQQGFFADARDSDAILAKYRNTGRVTGEEVQWRKKDGSCITVRLSGRAVADTGGEIEGLEVIVEDITEHKALGRQLVQAQKFEAIGQLAGGIAHDFNNVIGAVLGWAEIGEEHTAAGDPQAAAYFTKIRTQCDRATGLIRQLLAFARRQILAPSNLNLNRSVREVLSLLEKVIGKDIELKTALAEDLAVVRADPTQVEQVLMNLCLNSRDAMPSGGRLQIETRNVALTEAQSRAMPDVAAGSFVELSVADSGIGMDAATREHIFEPFFTTKGAGKGTGLGLATVYGIVRQHGGAIRVESEVNKGSTFRIYFPADSEAAAPTSTLPAEETRPATGGSETILLAEDHEGIREMARVTLESLGYRVLIACDGREAVEMFDANRNGISAVVLDVIMPRLGGRETYAEITKLRRDVPVVFATGYSNEVAALNEMLARGIAVLQKPYSPTLLARRVREALDRAAADSRPAD